MGTHHKALIQKVLSRYDYSFSKELIAQAPAVPRESARLLVYRRESGEVRFDRFSNIAKHLPPRTVLVFNRTKVIPARVTLIKPTGGRARVLFLGLTRGLWEVLSDRKLDAGSKLLSENAHFIVRQREGKSYFLKPSFPPRHTFSMLARFGKTPLPPYIKRSPLSESKLREKYQTVFAKTAGSVAAPTASLHFSKKLIATLRKNGIAVRFITLHVNLGTFAPLDKKQLKQGKLHSELYEIDASTARFLNKARKEKRPIIAVGTTVVRTLESACGANGHLHALRGATDLFIRGRYCFKAIDGIITNFHVPRSSLLMLVAAFVGREKTLELYRLAIKKRFRLFSFGDGMLLY